jgi:ribonuclease Y
VIETLLLDGKIFPKRIEEVIDRVKQGWDREITKIGEGAFRELGLTFSHPSISHVLGKLSFRYSFGQNLLDHSKEVGLILGNMAVELGLSEALGRRIGLLHDIGKAIVSEEKSHALAGMELLSNYGESPEVSNGVGCHHFEVEPITEIGSLCHLADALSAGKEGARRETLSLASHQKLLKGPTSFSK